MVFPTIAFLLLQLAGMARAFPDASWQSTWQALSAQTAASLDVTHGQGQLPVLVRVLVRAQDGANKDFVFEATGAPMRDDVNTDSGLAYGGVVFVYDDNVVKIMAPKKTSGAGGTDAGTAICVGDQAYTNGNSWDYCGAAAKSVQIKVKVWLESQLPPADFNSTWLPIKSNAGNESFQELQHGLGVLPEFVNVQVLNTGSGLIAEGVGSSQNDKTTSDAGAFSGTVYGYNEHVVRLWTPHEGQHSGLFSTKKGWGGSGIDFGDAAKVRVLAWKDLPNLTLRSEVTAGTDSMRCCLKDAFISVKVRAKDGPNKGFVFPGLGSTQNSGHNDTSFGGVLFGYSDNEIRMFRPKSKAGHLINIGKSWGNGLLTQQSDQGDVIIQAWRKANASSPCLDYIGDPSYESGWLDSSAWATNRKTVQHNLNQVPALTKVLAKVTKGANSGYVYEGIGYPQAQLQSQSKPYGSVFYFYDERTVTVVLPEKRIDGSVGAVCVGEPGYFDGCSWSQCEGNVSIRIQAWASSALPNFRSIAEMKSGQQFLELAMKTTITTSSLLRVQLKLIPNDIYLDGIGASNDHAGFYNGAGALYAYDSSKVRIWLNGLIPPSDTICAVEGKSWGENDADKMGHVKVNGDTILRSEMRGSSGTNPSNDPSLLTDGIGIVVLKSNCAVNATYRFSQNDKVGLQNLLASLPTGTVFIGISAFRSDVMNTQSKNAMTSQGVNEVNNLASKSDSLTFIAMVGDPSFARATVSTSGPIFVKFSFCLSGGSVVMDCLRMSSAEVSVSLWTDLPQPILYNASAALSTMRVINTTGLDLHKQLVSVSSKAKSGENNGFVFIAQGSAQNMEESGGSYGGLLYGRSSSSIRMFSPINSGKLINVGSKWGGGQKEQHSQDAEITVTIWRLKDNSDKLTSWDNKMGCLTTTTLAATTTNQQTTITSQSGTSTDPNVNSQIVNNITTSTEGSTTRKASTKWFRFGHTDDEIESWFNPIFVVIPVSVCAIPIVVGILCISKACVQTAKDKLNKPDEIEEMEMKEVQTTVEKENTERADQSQNSRPVSRVSTRSVSPYPNEGYVDDGGETERGLTPFPIYIP